MLRLELALRARDRGVDLCHAESRASLGAINRISYDLGMNFGGTLEKHLLISGPSDVNYQNPSRLESMHVWYLNRAQLAALETIPGLLAGALSALHRGIVNGYPFHPPRAGQ